MIKAGLIPDDKQIALDALNRRVDKIDTNSPYKLDRPRVKYFERPERISARIDKFREKATFDKTQTEIDLA